MTQRRPGTARRSATRAGVIPEARAASDRGIRRGFASTAAVAVVLFGLGMADGATAVNSAGDRTGKSTLSFRLTGGSAAQLEICDQTRRGRVVALGGAATARIKLADSNRRGARRGRLIVERCEVGRYRPVRSEPFRIDGRRGRARRYSERIDTTVAGDFRIRARLARGGPRQPALTRSAYLRVSESQPEDDSRARRFTYAGHCTELQMGVPVFGGAREVAEAVAVPFVPLGYPFVATVTVGVAGCHSTTADGKPIAPWTGGLAAIPVHPRGARPALERYWLWHVGNSPEVDEGFARLGLLSVPVPGIRLDVTPGAGFKEVLADVPWSESAYRLDARVVDAGAVPLAGTSVFWHQGPRGLVKVTYEISNGSVLSGNGTVIAAAGSRLARLVGTSASALGLLITFDFKSTAELAE